MAAGIKNIIIVARRNNRAIGDLNSNIVSLQLVNLLFSLEYTIIYLSSYLEH